MFNNKWKLLTTFGLAVWLGMTLVRLFQCGFVLDDVYLIVNTNRWLTEEAASDGCFVQIYGLVKFTQTVPQVITDPYSY